MVVQRREEVGKAPLRRFENVACELAMVGALLDDEKIVDLAESFPDLGELRGDQFSKDRSDADVGKVIAASSDGGAVAGIIAVFRMIQHLLHEPGERLGTAPLDRIADELDKISLQLENVERSAPNVQFGKYSTLNFRFDVGR